MFLQNAAIRGMGQDLDELIDLMLTICRVAMCFWTFHDSSSFKYPSYCQTICPTLWFVKCGFGIYIWKIYFLLKDLYLVKLRIQEKNVWWQESDWANKCSLGNNMAFNKGIGYAFGASVILGYCLEICLIVDGTKRKKFFLVFLLFLSSCPIHRSRWVWCAVSQRIISPHWSSSPRSWDLWIMLFVLVPRALSCQALCSVKVTRHSSNVTYQLPWKIRNIGRNSNLQQ